MMFDDILRQIEARLDIPYPHRTLVVQELESDMWAHFNSLRDEGLSEDEARATTLRDMALDEETLESLETIHNPAIRRILRRIPAPAREPIEWICAVIPLAIGIYFIVTEFPMSDFIREGGWGMYPVLFFGLSALVLQLRRAFSWFIQRDHSRVALARNTTTPLYLAAATVLMGFTTTASNFYVVLHRWADGQFPDGVVSARIGFYESVTPLCLAGMLATLIVLFQAALQTGLRAMQVKPAANG